MTEDKHLKGNTAHNRNAGIARFEVERDIYSEGQSRLHITLLALEESRQTEIQIAPELKGKVEKRGDIKYALFKPATSKKYPIPMTKTRLSAFGRRFLQMV